MNDLMSAGLHRLWKDSFVQKLAPYPGIQHVDVAGGTGKWKRRALGSKKSINFLLFCLCRTHLPSVCVFSLSLSSFLTCCLVCNSGDIAFRILEKCASRQKQLALPSGGFEDELPPADITVIDASEEMLAEGRGREGGSKVRCRA